MYEQLSLFDFMENKFEKSEEQKLFDRIVKQEILKGTGFVNGKERVIDHFRKEADKGRLAGWLKFEYGIGGRTFYYGSVHGWTNYDNNGFEIKLDEPLGKMEWMHIGWPMMVDRIREYINEGTYIADGNAFTLADNGNLMPCPYKGKCTTYGSGCSGASYWCERFKNE